MDLVKKTFGFGFRYCINTNMKNRIRVNVQKIM